MKPKKTPFFLNVFIILLLTLHTGTHVLASLSKDNATLPPIKRYTLRNGMTVILQEGTNSELVAFEAVVKTGSIYENRWLGTGIAHLVEHMLFKGTASRPVGAIEEEVKLLGGSINGYTSHQITGYTLVVPAEHVESGIDILSDMIMHPLFAETELHKEKNVVLNEIRLNRDDPYRYLNRILWKQIYAVTPYNLPVIGIEELFNTLQRNDLVDFHKKWYIPNNIILSVAGNINAEDALVTIENAFSDFSMQPYPDVALPRIPPLKGHHDYEEYYDIQSTHMLIGFPSVMLTSEDSAALDIIATIIGQGESSSLYKRLVKGEKLVYSVSAYNYTPGFPGIFVIRCILDYENKEEIIRGIFEELTRLKTKRLGRKALEKAKNSYLHDYIFGLDTVQSMAKMAASDEAYASNAEFSRHYLDSVARITPEDIQRAAVKYFQNDNFVSVLLRPKQAADPSTRDTAKTGEEAAIRKCTLDNGLRVLLKKDTSLPIISVQACIGGGVRWEQQANNGSFNLLSRMMKRGTRRRSSLQIAQELEQMGTRISPFSGYNSFGLSMDILSKDFDKGMAIFSDLISDPQFPEKELQHEKRIVLKEIQIQNDDIFRQTTNLMRKNLFTGYPYRFNPLGNETAITSIDREHLIELHQRHCRGPNMVIAVFGDINEETVIKTIKKYFGRLAGEPVREKPFFQEPPRKKQITVRNKRNKEQAVFAIGFPGCDVASSDRIALECVNSMLTSPGSILYKRIREKYGLTYALGGASVAGLDTGYFFIYVATKPENIDEIKKMVIEEIDNMKNGIPDEPAITATKTYLIGRRRVEFESNSARSFMIALEELYGLGTDYQKQFEQKIQKLESDTIRQAARKYLQTAKSVIVVTAKE